MNEGACAHSMWGDLVVGGHRHHMQTGMHVAAKTEYNVYDEGRF